MLRHWTGLSIVYNTRLPRKLLGKMSTLSMVYGGNISDPGLVCVNKSSSWHWKYFYSRLIQSDGIRRCACTRQGAMMVMSYSLGGHLAVLAVHKYSPALRNVWPLVTHSPPQPRWHCNASQQNIEILIFCLTEHSQHFPTCTEHMKCLASHYCKGCTFCNVYYSLIHIVMLNFTAIILRASLYDK